MRQWNMAMIPAWLKKRKKEWMCWRGPEGIYPTYRPTWFKCQPFFQTSLLLSVFYSYPCFCWPTWLIIYLYILCNVHNSIVHRTVTVSMRGMRTCYPLVAAMWVVAPWCTDVAGMQFKSPWLTYAITERVWVSHWPYISASVNESLFLLHSLWPVKSPVQKTEAVSETLN
jgi:hypothetical protein